MTTPESLIWNDEKAAAAIGITVKQIQALARIGALPAFKVGRFWKFDPDAIRSWIKAKSS